MINEGRANSSIAVKVLIKCFVLTKKLRDTNVDGGSSCEMDPNICLELFVSILEQDVNTEI